MSNIASKSWVIDLIKKFSAKKQVPYSNITDAPSIPSFPLSIENGGTGNTTGYVTAGQKSETTLGDKATAEGWNTTASGNMSHAEGWLTTASDICSHAEGNDVKASGRYSHAEGNLTIAKGEMSHAEGSSTHASGDLSHAEGIYTYANGRYSHAEGYGTIAFPVACHVGGYYNKQSGIPGSIGSKEADSFIIGNGTGNKTGQATAASNCFRVTFAGQVYALSAFNASGADYAEYFEWLDGNKEKEDRVGYFVTLEGNKIKKANKGDYILGVISGMPSVIGNGDEDWQQRWVKDDFGRRLMVTEDIEIDIPDGDNKTTKKKQTISTWKQVDDYDPSLKYVERKDRPEWDAVGMLGTLSVRDDGTCAVDSYCTCKDNGIATASDTGYRVIKRVSENVVQIIFK